MLKKTSVAAALAFALSGTAYAGCYGTGNYEHCYDSQSGNNYSIQHNGNTTRMRGYNSSTGSTWSETSHDYGSFTRHRGVSSDGEAWSSTTRNSSNSSSFGSGAGITGQGISNCGIAGCE
ncbi:hypothetical protein GCM10027040_27350 [Halomonas shantousis]